MSLNFEFSLGKNILIKRTFQVVRTLANAAASSICLRCFALALFFAAGFGILSKVVATIPRRLRRFFSVELDTCSQWRSTCSDASTVATSKLAYIYEMAGRLRLVRTFYRA